MLPRYINEAFLILTSYCPLRCSYCYVNDREEKTVMSLETVDKTLALFRDKPYVIFFGGEPLTEIDLIKQIMANYSGRIAGFQISTSGVVNIEQLYYDIYLPAKDRFEIQISWDGFTNTRKFSDGSPTATRAFDNILWLQKKGVPVCVRCVVSDDNIDAMYANYQLFCKHGLNGDFTLVHSPTRDAHYSQKLDQQLRLILEDIINGHYIPNFLDKMILNSVSNQQHASCDIGRYIAVTQDGSVYPCTILSQMNEYKLGNVHTGLDTEIMEELYSIPQKCTSCDWKSLCDGGCRYERIAKEKNWQQYVCGFNCDTMKVLHSVLGQFVRDNPTIIELLAQRSVANINYDTRR